MANNEKMIQIDRFVAESKRLLGKEIKERVLWNTHVSGDAIRHFALGIGDDNPLYIDPDYGHNSPYGRQLAPPAFLASVLYPMLRGAPMPVPLWFLAGEVTYQWFLPIIAGDGLRATSKLIDLYDTEGSDEERRAFIISETCYVNQNDLLIGKCIGTTVCVPKSADRLLIERPIYKYSEEEIERIGDAFREETRRGNLKFDDNELQVGQEIPAFVRGPLTIGDLICWQTAIGPAYQAGAPGFRKLVNSPHAAEKNPVTGWPVESSQQHEDFFLTSQRGMPLPFDQGVMRFACLSPMITNWIGDNGFLNSLSVKIIAPNLYGDTTWYHGSISKRSDHPESISLKLKIIGKNQLGETTTEAEAGVTLPRKEALTFHRYGGFEVRALEKKATFQEAWAKDVFEGRALRHPDAIALVFRETRLTYEEVNHQANRLADNLLSIGVGANEPVALCMGRSHNFIVAVLGILKAATAYVPMDPDYPRKRLDEMLEDCGAQVLIVDDTVDRDFQGYSGKKISFDAFRKNIHMKGDVRHARKIKKEDLVYIMYTSGSVGKAKGVAITQGNLSSYLLGLKETFDIDDGDIYVHTASFAFSASVRQIFLPLCVGATLVIADTEQRGDPIALAELIRREGVTHWDTVPSFFSLCCDTFMKLDSVRKSELLNNRLRRIMVTGEPLTREAPCAWNQTLKHNAKIVNLYSQTETSGTVCTYEVSKDFALVSENVPIGVPTPDTAIYILDENQRPVSYGEVGEICVAGPRIAKGYLNRPELTANQFISHPFNVETDSRVLKTGDLGCYLPDGNIVIKGRRDRRVKIRGFRIELEEIERALSTHPAITRAAVVASDGNGHEARLLAYFVPKGNPAPKEAELRTYLQGTLPDYMLPSYYVMLEEIPLSPNGKVDYQALPVPDQTRPELENAFVAPSTSVEKILVGIWTEVLNIDHLGSYDNFFELGGHSLLAARMLIRLRDVFQIDLSLRSIFEAPTVAELSVFITRSVTENTSSVEKLNIIDELDDMSEEEAQKLLAEEMKATNLE